MQKRNGGEFASLRPIDGSFRLNCTRCESVHPADEVLELTCAGGYPIGSIEVRGFYAPTRDANETPSGDHALGHLDVFYGSSTSGAFDKECRNDHAFGGAHGLDIESRPLSPPGSLRRRLVDDQ